MATSDGMRHPRRISHFAEFFACCGLAAAFFASDFSASIGPAFRRTGFRMLAGGVVEIDSGLRL